MFVDFFQRNQCVSQAIGPLDGHLRGNLKATFANSLAAWDAINSFRREALPNMKQTITELESLSEQQAQLTEKMERGSQMRHHFAGMFSLESGKTDAK